MWCSFSVDSARSTVPFLIGHVLLNSCYVRCVLITLSMFYRSLYKTVLTVCLLSNLVYRHNKVVVLDLSAKKEKKKRNVEAQWARRNIRSHLLNIGTCEVYTWAIRWSIKKELATGDCGLVLNVHLFTCVKKQTGIQWIGQWRNRSSWYQESLSRASRCFLVSSGEKKSWFISVPTTLHKAQWLM